MKNANLFYNWLKTITKTISNILKISFFYFFLSYDCCAQEEGKFRLSLITERVEFEDRIIQTFGLNAEYFVSDYISISYAFDFGATDKGEFATRIPTGTWLAVYPFTIYINTDEEFYLYLSVLLVAVPEAINFHVRVSENFFITPYLAPLGMYYEEKSTDINSSFVAGFGAGLKLNIFSRSNNLSLIPYVGARSLYRRNSKWGLLAGASLGVSF